MGKKDLFQIIFSVSVGLLMAGLILIINRPVPTTEITLNTPLPPPPITVYITGEIQNPGLYELPKNARLNDLILVAGGTTTEAALDNYNLAAKLYDGQHIEIKNNTDSKSANQLIETLIDPSSSLVNINEAGVEELDSLPGIGESKAKAIVQYRIENGPFEKIEDILNVPGIGEHTYSQFKDRIIVNQIYK